MAYVVTCTRCGGETRLYDEPQAQPCRACLVKEIEGLRAEATVRNADFDRRIDAAQALLSQVELERDQLQAIVDKLPKTADGVPVVPGMDLWKLDTDGTVYQFMVTQVRCDGVLAGMFHGYSDGPHDVATCYFTRPTAEAGRKPDAK